MTMKLLRHLYIIKNIKVRNIFLMFCFLCICITRQVSGGVDDGSQQKYRSRIIDHSITLERSAILGERIDNSGGTDTESINKLKDFTGKTIFWTGRVVRFMDNGDYFWILSKTGEGRYFWIYAKKTIRNLDFDRTGYSIGVKGNISLRNNKFSYVTAASIILVEASPEIALDKFIEKHGIPSSFTLNTSKGPVEVSDIYYPFVVHRIYMHNPHYPLDTILKVSANIIYYCHKFNIDPLLMTALINIESAFDVDAVSSAGAVGLGQLMPSTAAGLGVDPYDPVQNIGGAARYFSSQLRRWNHRDDHVKLALASYNAGPGAVASYGNIPPYSETINYVYFITFLREQYRKQLRTGTLTNSDK